MKRAALVAVAVAGWATALRIAREWALSEHELLQLRAQTSPDRVDRAHAPGRGSTTPLRVIAYRHTTPEGEVHVLHPDTVERVVEADS